MLYKSLFIGWTLGVLSTIVVDWIRYRRKRKSLIRVVKYEIQENVDLLEKAKKSTDKWPAFLLYDIYTSNLGNIHLLKEKQLIGVLLHYKKAQRFVQELRDIIEKKVLRTTKLPDRAKEALESGQKALEILS